MADSCVRARKEPLRWWEHYKTKSGLMKRKTLEGFWCETHRKPHATKVIEAVTVDG